MRILLASGELYPYSKTGGLADMVAALAKALAKAGHQVAVVTPLYRGVKARNPDIKPFPWHLALPVGDRTMQARLWVSHPRRGLTIYFVNQPDYYDRASIYHQGGIEYPDNSARFTFLSKCVAHLARHLPLQPELVHVHDWHVGAVPMLIRHQAAHEGWINPPRTCLTIHNLAYQGRFAAVHYRELNLPWDYFNADGMEFYGDVNHLKAGIAFSDEITTVSPRYAQEITTPEFGCGLDGILRARAQVLTGILNGADYEEWRTTRNKYLPHAYSSRDMSGKAVNKRALQAELGMTPSPQTPLFGSVTRLAHQKGVEIQLAALEEMLATDMQFVLLGSGQIEFETAFMDLAKQYPGKVAVRIGYDHGLAHRVEAGSDFFLMPSQFEPCGLNQMYSLRYGTVPIVRAIGGLDDSVIDLREDPDHATGIKFHEYISGALVKAIRKAQALWQEPALLEHLRQNGMQEDFSWEHTAGEYVAVYQTLLTPPTPVTGAPDADAGSPLPPPVTDDIAPDRLAASSIP